MDFYKKNLQALSEVNAPLCAQLYSVSSNQKYEVYVDEKDPININLYDKENDYIFYDAQPLAEITKQYEEMFQEYARHPFLWFFGISNGLLIKMFLNLGKTIFVFEPELELLYIAFNLFDLSDEIRTKRLQIFLTKEFHFNIANDITDKGDVKVFLKTYSLEPTHKYYDSFYFEDLQFINKTMIEAIRNTITKEGNAANDSLIGLDHHLKHIPQMVASYPLKDIKKNTENAIIVSTGPSLAKQLPLLKEYQDYVTILCIDASLPILQKEKIAPDFVFSLERVEETARFYENLDRELLKDTIFMPTSIVHPKTLENIGDMKKAISMRPFGYTYAFNMPKWGYIGIGMSAANMAFDFAYILKFKNIVLIGQDLAFAPDGKTHSKGAIYGEKEEQYEQDTLMIKGYYGDEVKTSKWWHIFLSTFIHDIPKVKEDGMNVYNCTEGGAYIDGAIHIPFKDFLIENTKEKKQPIEAESIPQAKQLHYLKRVKKIITLYTQRLEWIKSEVENTFLNVMKTIEMLEQYNDENRLEEIEFDQLAAVIGTIDKIKDIYENDKVLRKFGNITNPYIVNAELELAVIMVRPSDTEIEKKKKMIDWIYEHKSWLFFLAGAIENVIYLMQENYKEIYKNM